MNEGGVNEGGVNEGGKEKRKGARGSEREEVKAERKGIKEDVGGRGNMGEGNGGKEK